MLFDRLRRLTKRHFDSPMRDMGTLCAMGVEVVSEETLDDVLAYLARYLRQPIAWLEELPLVRLFAWHAACNRLVALENGKRPALDIGGEETR